MTTINLVATDQVLAVALQPKLASGDLNSVLLHVDFDSKWDRYVKSAVFFTSNSKKAYEMILTDNECTIPHEVLAKAGVLNIGVRGVNSATNAVKTSTLVKYRIVEGAPSGSGTTEEPTPSVYQQLLALSEETRDIVAESEQKIQNLNYAAGSWTPTIANATFDGLVVEGRFTKVGSTVHLWCTLSADFYGKGEYLDIGGFYPNCGVPSVPWLSSGIMNSNASARNEGFDSSVRLTDDGNQYYLRISNPVTRPTEGVCTIFVSADYATTSVLDQSEVGGGVGAVSSVNGKTGAVRLSAADVGALAPEEDGSIVVQKQVKVLNANGNGGGIVMVAEGNPGDMRVHFHDAVSYSSPVRLSNLEEPESPNDAVTFMFMDKFVQNAVAGAGGTAAAKEAVDAHNVSTDAHGDLRLLIEGLTTRLNALANSTDADLDQMAEIVTYIKSNKSLIDGITTSKVNVSDIINNLTTNASNKPLSAAQGVALKKYIDDALAEFDGGGNSGGGSSELVVVTVTQASDGAYNADMTAAEIHAEWLAGKCIQLRYGSSTYAIVNSTETSCSFVSIMGLDENVFAFSTNGSIAHYTYKFARKEDVESSYTPQRGVDYWTEADKAEIKGYVDEAILGGEW